MKIQSYTVNNGIKTRKTLIGVSMSKTYSESDAPSITIATLKGTAFDAVDLDYIIAIPEIRDTIFKCIKSYKRHDAIKLAPRYGMSGCVDHKIYTWTPFGWKFQDSLHISSAGKFNEGIKMFLPDLIQILVDSLGWKLYHPADLEGYTPEEGRAYQIINRNLEEPEISSEGVSDIFEGKENSPYERQVANVSKNDIFMNGYSKWDDDGPHFAMDGTYYGTVESCMEANQILLDRATKESTPVEEKDKYM